MKVDWVEHRLQSYEIKGDTLFQQSLREIHKLALKVIYQNQNSTTRLRLRTLKTYLAQLPLIVRESLYIDVLPRCSLCRNLLVEAESEFCVRGAIDQYVFILRSGLSLSGHCYLRVKEHFAFIVFDQI